MAMDVWGFDVDVLKGLELGFLLDSTSPRLSSNIRIEKLKIAL